MNIGIVDYVFFTAVKRKRKQKTVYTEKCTLNRYDTGHFNMVKITKTQGSTVTVMAALDTFIALEPLDPLVTPGAKNGSNLSVKLSRKV